MFFRIFIAVLVLTGAFALYKIYSVHNYYVEFREPLAEFTVYGSGNHKGLTIVEFMNYDCGWCKDTHLTLLHYVERHSDVRLVVRPVPFANNDAETAAERALAAGLQGKFQEMDSALSEYKGKLDEKFYRESAAVYDIDYERMVREAEEQTVQDMAKDNASSVTKAGFKTTPAIIIGKTFYELDKPLTDSDLIRMVESEK